MTAVGQPPASPSAGTLLCPRCGSALSDAQGWCLECGLAARTRVHPPPSWRMPIALTAVLLALLAAGITVALVTLLDAPESAPAPTTVTVPATAPAASTPAATVPTITTPAATTPTVPTTTAPAATTPGSTTPSGTATQRTFTIPGTRIRLPANALR
ncbi:MAG TPA: hypothetical protein VF250_16820 [Conexibacter sp.]